MSAVIPCLHIIDKAIILLNMTSGKVAILGASSFWVLCVVFPCPKAVVITEVKSEAGLTLVVPCLSHPQTSSVP